MSEEKTYTGTCFCGEVEVSVTGDPVKMGYCHCESCRAWSAGPVTAFSLFPQDNVKVTKGADKLGTYNKSGKTNRRWCTACGGNLMAEHPGFGLTDVYPALLAGLDFSPKAHVFYSEKMINLVDGLPKFKDIPGEMGGSGETLPE